MLDRRFARDFSTPDSGIGALPGEGSNTWLWVLGVAATAVIGAVWWKAGQGKVGLTWTEEQEANAHEERMARANKQPEYRARDRLAQRDPQWAVENNQRDYKRGVEQAKPVYEAAEWIAEQTLAGEKVVIHGRDGDIFYQLLKRMPRSKVDMSKISYLISSRPLTTEHPHEGYRESTYHYPGDERSRDPEYDAYMRRLVPRGAIHVDTGFAGSIPKWMDRYFQERMPTTREYEPRAHVKQIKMLSADREENLIPIKSLDIKHKPSSERMATRRGLVDSIEHTSLRLQKFGGNDETSERAARPWGKGRAAYSRQAPGFWAYLYGIEDAMRGKAKPMPDELDMPIDHENDSDWLKSKKASVLVKKKLSKESALKALIKAKKLQIDPKDDVQWDTKIMEWVHPDGSIYNPAPTKEDLNNAVNFFNLAVSKKDASGEKFWSAAIEKITKALTNAQKKPNYYPMNLGTMQWASLQPPTTEGDHGEILYPSGTIPVTVKAAVLDGELVWTDADGYEIGMPEKPVSTEITNVAGVLIDADGKIVDPDDIQF